MPPEPGGQYNQPDQVSTPYACHDHSSSLSYLQNEDTWAQHGCPQTAVCQRLKRTQAPTNHTCSALLLGGVHIHSEPKHHLWLRCPPCQSTVSLCSKFETPPMGKLFNCVVPHVLIYKKETTILSTSSKCVARTCCSTPCAQHQLPGQGFPALAPQTSRRGSFLVGAALRTAGPLAAPLASAHPKAGASLFPDNPSCL